MTFLPFAVLFMWLMSAAVWANYGYPVKNSFLATVAGTPSGHVYALEQTVVSEVVLNVHKATDAPAVFSEVSSPAFKLAWQHNPAPLIFIIAGTGGRYDAHKVEYLKRVYYQAGYHVIQLSSPTSYDFIVNSSKEHRPGLSRTDASDLYQLMQQALKRTSAFKKLRITNFQLTGYSLGAANAVWVGYLDASQKKIGFQRILLINPPVSLKTAMDNLDRMILAKVPGVKDSSSLFDHFFTRLADYFRVHKSIDLDKSLLFELQKSPAALSSEELALLIGLVFRFSVASMTFTSDVMTSSGFIVPKGVNIKNSDDRTPYFARAMSCSFNHYFQKLILPVQKKTLPMVSEAQLLRENSLPYLKRWLQNVSHIGVMHNADDFILDQKGLSFLYDVFDRRVVIYPHGGHMGNLEYQQNIKDMLGFMQKGAFPDA